MEFGVTPIEAAFEAIGLHNAYLLTLYLFKNSPWGMIAFGIGFFIALSKFLNTNNFKHMTNFMLLSGFILLLFIIPTTSLGSISSTMEQRGGFKEIKAQDIFSQDPRGREVSSSLLFISQCFNSIVIGAGDALSLAVDDDNFNYLKSPFLAQKVTLEMQRFLNADIKDIGLKGSLDNFVRKYYLPALNKMEEDKVINNNNRVFLWPGKEIMKSYYPQKGKEEWEQLRLGLIEYIKSKKTIFDYYTKVEGQVEKFTKSDPVQEEVVGDNRLVLALLNKQLFEKPKLAFQMAGPKPSKSLSNFSNNALGIFNLLSNLAASVFSFIGGFIADFFSRTAFMFFLKAHPYIQGYLVLILFSLFPATIIFALISGEVGYFSIFIKSLFYVKALSVIWMIIAAASKYVIEIQARMSPSSDFLIESPVHSAVVFSFILLSPAFSYYFVNGTLASMSSVTSAIMGTGTKSTGRAEGEFDKALQKVKKTLLAQLGGGK